MKSLLKKLVRHLAYRHGRAVSAYIALCQPDGLEWAQYLRKRGQLHSMGEHCSIQTNVSITDPAYTRLGNNVRLSGCTLFGHDGSVNMLNRAYGLRLDSVGKIDIGNNVFIGHQAIVLPSVRIGDDVIVAAGSVVTSDLAAGGVYGGIPAKRICSISEMVERRRAASDAYPWAQLIAQREGAFDAAMEPELVRLRVAHFFPDAIKRQS